MGAVEESGKTSFANLTAENSIEFALNTLNSDNNQTRLDTIIQVSPNSSTQTNYKINNQIEYL